jgi:hypothetical protein
VVINYKWISVTYLFCCLIWKSKLLSFMKEALMHVDCKTLDLMFFFREMLCSPSFVLEAWYKNSHIPGVYFFICRAKGGARNLFYPGLWTNKQKLFFNIHHWIDTLVLDPLFSITSLMMHGNFRIINRRIS